MDNPLRDKPRKRKTITKKVLITMLQKYAEAESLIAQGCKLRDRFCKGLTSIGYNFSDMTLMLTVNERDYKLHIDEIGSVEVVVKRSCAAKKGKQNEA